MTIARITVYAMAMVACALAASASVTLTIVAVDSEGLSAIMESAGALKPVMPKPPTYCPTCRDAKDSTSIANGE